MLKDQPHLLRVAPSNYYEVMTSTDDKVRILSNDLISLKSRQQMSKHGASEEHCFVTTATY